MLKYGAVGALAAAAITLLTKLLGAKQKQKQEQADTFEYSKLQALIDAPEYACEILLYED